MRKACERDLSFGAPSVRNRLEKGSRSAYMRAVWQPGLVWQPGVAAWCGSLESCHLGFVEPLLKNFQRVQLKMGIKNFYR